MPFLRNGDEGGGFLKSMSETQDLLSMMESALAEEYEYYQRVEKLSLELSENLRSTTPDAEKIAKLIDRKLAILNEVHPIEDQHQPIKKRWESEYQSFNQTERKKIADAKNRLLALFERLNRMEFEIGQAIREQMTAMSRDLNRIQKNREATQAYFQTENPPPRFIDKIK